MNGGGANGNNNNNLSAVSERQTSSKKQNKDADKLNDGQQWGTVTSWGWRKKNTDRLLSRRVLRSRTIPRGINYDAGVASRRCSVEMRTKKLNILYRT